jgi:transposase-like protein
MARQRLAEFGNGEWGRKYPAIVPAWERQWEHVTPVLAYPREVRRIIYTTNALESVNMCVRKIIKTRGHFPSDEAATKLIYLALRNIWEDWTMPAGVAGRHDPVRASVWRSAGLGESVRESCANLIARRA